VTAQKNNVEGKRFIRTLRLQNLLSYGSEGETIELQPLNVLIGPLFSSLGASMASWRFIKKNSSSMRTAIFTTITQIMAESI
jgi:predicted ATPase